ncbi:MAG: ATP-dependent helicase [Gaiellaceae bacterium]
MAVFRPTAEQKRVLEHDISRSARVLAGPGTGKSATVVALIEQLLAERPDLHVRLLTFTRAATSELAKKVSEDVAAEVERPSTVHSFAISVLLRNGGAGDFPRPLRMADDWEQRYIVYETLARRTGVSVGHVRWLFGELAANWESLRPEEHPKVTAKERSRFQGVWQEHRRALGYTLMAELPYQLLQALLQHDDLEGLDYVLLVVDEYQDLNACDLKVLKLLNSRGCSILAAGDDDQSIYSFRRADPAGIRRFPADYPGADDYTLSLTRRCCHRIVGWAGWVIAGDPSRPDGRALPVCGDNAREGEVALLSFQSNAKEVQGVAGLVEKLHRVEGIPCSEILILVRGDHGKHFSRPIREELNRRNIQSADPDLVKEMLADPRNRRALAIYRLLVNQTDSLAWATLFSLEPGVGPAFFTYLYEDATKQSKQFGEVVLELHKEQFEDAPAPSRTKANAVVDSVLGWLEDQTIPDSRPDEGWGAWLEGTSDGDVVPEFTEEFGDLLRQIDEVIEPVGSLTSYLNQIAPLGKDIALAEADGVRIMTMAGSKGLTVRATIVIGCEDGVVPHPRADLSEERRLLYVAMTRSKEFLYCTWSRRRSGPTARSGTAGTGLRRHTHFFTGGPVASVNGESYIQQRW